MREVDVLESNIQLLATDGELHPHLILPLIEPLGIVSIISRGKQYHVPFGSVVGEFQKEGSTTVKALVAMVVGAEYPDTKKAGLLDPSTSSADFKPLWLLRFSHRWL